MKVCSKCKRTLPLDSFYKNGRYRQAQCKKCHIKQVDSNPNKKRYDRKTRYGISQEKYDTILIAQAGLCKICNNEVELFVDHCHTTNKIRGLLCSNCNLLLGHAKDNLEILRMAIYYLEQSNA